MGCVAFDECSYVIVHSFVIGNIDAVQVFARARPMAVLLPSTALRLDLLLSSPGLSFAVALMPALVGGTRILRLLPSTCTGAGGIAFPVAVIVTNGTITISIGTSAVICVTAARTPAIRMTVSSRVRTCVCICMCLVIVHKHQPNHRVRFQQIHG